MNERSEQHLARIKAETVADLDAKYRRGNQEHANDLLDMDAVQLIDEAIAEATDQIVYLRTLREKILRRKAMNETDTERRDGVSSEVRQPDRAQADDA